MKCHTHVLGLLSMAILLADAKVAELSSSIIITGHSDYAMEGRRSRCTDMVDRAANLTNSRLNFVPTLFWVSKQPQSNRQTFQASRGTSDAHFCVKQTVHPDRTVSCPSVTQQDIQEFTYGMHKCFARAAAYNLSIAITPQLEDGIGNNISRNTLLFDPLMPYQQYSYMDVMLRPLANAVKGVITDRTNLWFALEGGAGASLFHHPRSYLEAMQTLRRDLIASIPQATQSKIKFGISSNFNKLCGCSMLDVAEPNDYLSRFPEAFNASNTMKTSFDSSSIQKFFHSVDFIGVSLVGFGLRPGFPVGDLQYAMNYFTEELSFFGVNVSRLLQESDLELHWSDFGVGGGGGLGPQKGVPARDATQAAKFPFVGIVGPYQRKTDPWMLYSIESTHSPVRDYASFFYQQAVEYLWKQYEYKWPVDAAFLRNVGSWDIQAVHPESSSAEGSYLHPTVLAVIHNHNARAQRLMHLTENLGEVCVKFLLDSKQPDFGQRIRAASSVERVQAQFQANVAAWR